MLVLDVDAPVGWVHWLRGGLGPARLSLAVRDVDDYIDAMEFGCWQRMPLVRHEGHAGRVSSRISVSSHRSPFRQVRVVV